MNFWKRYFGGHFSIGRMTIYGDNAMHWAINIKTRRWGYVCFRLPVPCCDEWRPLYFYLSPNATPWGSTLLIGRGYSHEEKRRASVRRKLWGHGYDSNALDPQDESIYFDGANGEQG